MRAISKAFGPVKALDDASIAVRAGTIHGIVGQNGAGKSTIIKILAGIYRIDVGTVAVHGEVLERITPTLIERHGIHFIHQDRLLVPASTVAEAIFLGREPTIGPFVRHGAMRREAAALVRKYFGIEIDPDSLIRDLTTAEQKVVQITRALANEARVLVLDEPTAALVKQEVERLFEVLRRLRDDGIAIVFISHYIQEIQDLCDVVTVLRNGTDVGHLQRSEMSVEAIVALMTNRSGSDMYPARTPTIGRTALQAEGLSLRGCFEDISFEVRAGEIIGLSGLLGSGAKDLLRCLFGLEVADGGTIRVNGEQRVFGAPGDAVTSGIALVPEDRRAHGVALSLSVAENVSLPSIGRIADFGFVSRPRESRLVGRLVERLAVKTPGHRTLVRNLSGGNQQKVVVAKWLSCDSRVYLLDEPTVAVDVGAKVEIYKLINELAEEGAAVVFLSSDLDELLEICDRVLVMYRGRLAREFARGTASSDQLMAAASGGGTAAGDGSWGSRP